VGEDAPDGADAVAIARAVDVLMHGGLVAFPTETVYGLGADADRDDAVAAIFRAKGRPRAHPLILHVAQPGALHAWAREVPRAAQALVEAFWPGPLTLILPRAPRARDAVTGGQDTVGVRCPSHPWAAALLREFCRARGDEAAAVAAPSANRYGRISPTSAAHVRADLGEKPGGAVDYILDGGRCPLGIESTIVDFAAGTARVLRPGSIRREQIAAVLGGQVDAAREGDSAPRVSGRVAGHYAPRKPLELVAPDALAARAAALQPARLAVLAPAGVALSAVGVVLRLEAAAAPEAYAHALYEQLRRLDASAAERLLIAMPPVGPCWDAVHDRLRRAAAGSEGPAAEID
jgi:L-threonylcarbamoyladenylate synthase